MLFGLSYQPSQSACTLHTTPARGDEPVAGYRFIAIAHQDSCVELEHP